MDSVTGLENYYWLSTGYVQVWRADCPLPDQPRVSGHFPARPFRQLGGGEMETPPPPVPSPLQRPLVSPFIVMYKIRILVSDRWDSYSIWLLDADPEQNPAFYKLGDDIYYGRLG